MLAAARTIWVISSTAAGAAAGAFVARTGIAAFAGGAAVTALRAAVARRI